MSDMRRTNRMTPMRCTMRALNNELAANSTATTAKNSGNQAA